MKVSIYSNKDKDCWNNFLINSKNSHFMFNRKYMEYHSDRYKDFSLIFRNDKNAIKAVFPANISDDVLNSHEGLTFGGLCVHKNITAIEVHEIFHLLIDFSKTNKIKKILYKRLPDFYTSYPSQEDLYSLFLLKAKLFRRDISTTIELKNIIPFSVLRTRKVKKALKSGLFVEETDHLLPFWKILENVLSSQHKTKPVHSLNDMIKLKKKFSNNIKCFVAKKNDQVLAGILIFETIDVAHTQYLANSKFGRTMGALDLIVFELVYKVYKSKKYFNFGISTENMGTKLNNGLIFQKEGFGGRGQVHEFYEIDIN